MALSRVDLLRQQANHIVSIEARAVQNVPFGEEFFRLLGMVENRPLRSTVWTTGMGKAGLAAQKCAATLSATGTPAHFLHPGDALHGDAGVLRPADFLLAFSHSGQTREVHDFLVQARALGVAPIVGITSHPEHMTDATFCVPLGEIQEACPIGVTPSSSTLAMIALGDVLAFLLFERAHPDKTAARRCFAMCHHGGYLGSLYR